MTSSTRGYTLPAHVLDRFREVLGDDAVGAATGDFRDPYWHLDDHAHEASVALFPSSTEQVQAVVRIANEYGVPLWTSSQGRNFGYGGPSPSMPGTVVVNLRRMNRILEINHELAYAVVEPGVSWSQLYDELQATGNGDLMISVPDLGWGSIIGNSLDNGVTYLPYGSDFQSPCGMEVVLPDGTLLRTGMGAIEGNQAWHTYRRSLGPTLDPLFTQSNLGIVTRMGFWLMRRPEAYAPFFLTIKREDQLAQAVDICRELRLDGVLRGVPGIYTSLTLAPQIPSLGVFRGGDRPMTDAELDEFGETTGMGRWAVRAAIWGDRPVVDHHLQRLRDAWAELEGSSVMAERTFSREDAWDVDNMPSSTEYIHAGIPSLRIIENMPENLGHVGFSPVVPAVGREVRKVVDLMSRVIRTEAGKNFAGSVKFINERSCLVISGINFDVTDRAETERSYAAAHTLVREAGALGYGEYRAHIDFMDLAADQYSYNDHAYRRFVETLKDAVDPKGILSPGRHGIWPEHLREAGDRVRG